MADSAFTVRRATSGDIPAAKALMLRTLKEDFQTAYDPQVQRDISDIAGTFLTSHRRVLFVGVDDATGEILATGGVRGGFLRHGPAALSERYDDERTAQLVRVYVREEDRRRGIARAIVRELLAFILADGGYSTIALHTFPHSPGAMAFWASIGTVVAALEREGQYPQVFFEITLEQARAIAKGRCANNN